MTRKAWRKRRTTVLKTTAFFLVCGCGAAFAHHSFSMFVPDKTVTVTGTLADFTWTNPHIWFDLMVPDDKGVATKWGIEADSPATLTRGGWKYSAVHVGDKMTFVLHPLKDGKPGGSLVSATLANGTVVGRGKLSGLPEGNPTSVRGQGE